MAKYQVLKRTPATNVNYRTGKPEAGEIVEFIQIPDEGVSQVQVYFVPGSIPEAEILGVSAAHHETEIKEKNIQFQGGASVLNGVPSKIEAVMEVEIKAGKVTSKEAVIAE